MVVRVQPALPNPQSYDEKIYHVCSENVVKYAPKYSILKQKFQNHSPTPARYLQPLVCPPHPTLNPLNEIPSYGPDKKQTESSES